MAKKDHLSRVESRWALFEAVGKHFPLVGAAMSGVLAYFTDFMDAWSPLSWFAAAAVGWLVFSGVQLALSAKRERDERARRIALLEAPKGQVNPLDERFVGQRIYVSDILPPLGRVVQDKEFRQCEIIGPANIVFSASRKGGGELVESHLIGSEGVIYDENVVPANAVTFYNCSFKGCRFYNVTILMPLSAYKLFKPALMGLVWLNAAIAEKADASS